MAKKISGLTEAKYQKLINDIKSNKYKNVTLIEKYKMTTANFYSLTQNLRKKGLIPASAWSEKLKSAFSAKTTTADTSVKKENSNGVKVTFNEYRTVFFKDFSVQIHKKALAKLVVDQHNNLHILNN